MQSSLERHAGAAKASTVNAPAPMRAALPSGWPCTATSRTIALETGIQNGPLAVLIVLLTFSGEMQQQVLLIPVLYSLFIVLSSSAVTIWFRRITTREELARDGAKVPTGLAPAAS